MRRVCFSILALVSLSAGGQDSRTEIQRYREMIAEGVPLSDAAAATGFADQSHLTRHFAARFGLTPGRWATLARQS